MAVTAGAGYSGTPLPRKLGLKPAARIVLRHAPPGFEKQLAPIPPEATIFPRLIRDADVIIAFYSWETELRREIGKLLDSIRANGMIWIAWPKKAAKHPGDITEDRVRAVALPEGLVDVKVCAIDNTWSGLKLVLRLEKR